MWEGDASQEILDLMGDSLKEYFEADLVDDPNKKGAKRIQLNKKLKHQNW